MNLGIDGRVALVAAASRGLGKAVALRLADEGARVAICARSKDAIDAACSDIARQTGGTIKGYVADVTDTGQVTDLAGRVQNDLGDIGILIANSGGPPSGMATEFTVADFRRAAELNLMSTISMCQAVLPAMKAKTWGRIVAITSVAARQPVESLILSNTVRAGVLGYIKSLSAQVATDGITANSVCPGYTRTERLDELAAEFVAAGKGTREDFDRKIEADVPMKRMGTPAEFADVVAFLASDRASYVTGVALPIDGGWVKSLY